MLQPICLPKCGPAPSCKLPSGWDSPDDVLQTPRLSSLSPKSAAVDSANVTMHVYGYEFTPASKIIFNGGAETTVFVSRNEVTTLVEPSTASGLFTVPIQVRTAGKTSNTLQFSFTPKPAEPVEDEAGAGEVL